jgi:predicted ArsR family transcriptional regulator
MHTTTIIQCLKKHGQLLDTEIAAATGIPLAKVRFSLSDLSARGEISRCSVTRFTDGKPIEGFLCRIAGYVPPPAAGRKPAAKNQD